MNRATMLAAMLGAGLVLAAATADAAAPPPIAPGTYHCIAGTSRLMLTLGDMKISGMNYVFTAPTGPATNGTYALTATGYHWSGDISAITNDQIVDSGPDATKGDFWFTFKARPTSLPTEVACQRL